MAIQQIPKFPFPAFRSVTDVLELLGNPKATQFLADMETTRKELNRLLQSYGTLEELQSQLSAAESKQRQASLYLDEAKKQAKQIVDEAKQKAKSDNEALRVQVSEDRASHQKWLDDIKEQIANANRTLEQTTRKIAEDKATHERQLEQDNSRLAEKERKLDDLRRDYEDKLGRLKDAMANV